jgi:death-on-curing protein
MMQEPLWISNRAVLAIHKEQLAEHGGLSGLRDEGLLESALSRPRNLFVYEESADIFMLAAAYAYGIAKNHPFVDGNKRTALTVSMAFLDRNGWDVVAQKDEEYLTFFHLADGSLSEEELAQWFRSHAEQL